MIVRGTPKGLSIHILRRIQTINVDSVIMTPKERSICFRHKERIITTTT